MPVPDPLPSPYAGRFDYISQNPSNEVDQIIVAKGSQPVALSTGVWYLGVFNLEANPVTYAICATESSGLPSNIIRLTNDVPLNFSIPAGSPLTNFFLFTIDQTNSSVTFSLYNLNNPAELLVDLDILPDPAAALPAASRCFCSEIPSHAQSVGEGSARDQRHAVRDRAYRNRMCAFLCGLSFCRLALYGLATCDLRLATCDL